MSKIYNVLDVSLYVAHHSAEKGTPISNLQLQKILYYIQAMFLVNKGVECFNEEILHWNYGPVIREAYDEFKVYGNGFIPKDVEYSKIIFDSKTNQIDFSKESLDDELFCLEDIVLMNVVIDAYRTKAPFELVNKTHQEDPWSKTQSNEIIPKQKIEEYYKNNKERILK
ncbi:Panacea domain-containing protein [Clostridium cagae]|uniref:Panacea domain-containing protein n=1 Tax=Clostridium cagae TaxID=2080751 RepID=UPI003F76FC7C